jgi:hypothetical protein
MALGATDLFTAGLGAEIAGAALLAKGLLLSPTQLASRSRAYYDISPVAVLTLSEDRVDALFGVGGLLAGFALQIVGYFLSLASMSDDSGITAAGISVVFPFAAAALVVIPWWRLRQRLVMRCVVNVAKTVSPPAADGLPDAHLLATVGQTMGFGRVMHRGLVEADQPFAERVFGVKVADETAADVLRNLRSGQPTI